VSRDSTRASSPGVTSAWLTAIAVIADPEALLDQAARVSRVTELDCFAKVLELVEQNGTTLDARARAWANGDIEALRRTS
jgi:hypothetical protein